MPTRLDITRQSGFDRGKSVSFIESPVVLGTDATSSLRFDPTWDKTVSSRHASIEWHEGAWWIFDHSREGCWIQGQRLTGSRKLEPTTELELGQGGPKIILTQAVAAAEAPAPSGMVAPPVADLLHSSSTAPARTISPPPLPSPSARSGKSLWIAGGALLLLVLLAAIVMVLSRRATDEALAEVAQKYEEAVGLVVIVGDDGPVPFGTAWAVGDHVLATNSHVAEPVGQILSNDGIVYVILNRHPDKKFRVTQAVVHSLYGQIHKNAEGQETAVPAFDVGLLVVEETLPVVFQIAPPSKLKKLRSGSRVAYLGFPSEGLAGGGVDLRNPVATMQSGIVTSVTDWWLGKADFDKALLVQHNLGATGGASGSPIFNPQGQVVALLSAGNIVGQVSVDTEGKIDVQRAPSAAMINFGQRADLLNEFIDNAKAGKHALPHK